MAIKDEVKYYRIFVTVPVYATITKGGPNDSPEAIINMFRDWLSKNDMEQAFSVTKPQLVDYEGGEVDDALWLAGGFEVSDPWH